MSNPQFTSSSGGRRSRSNPTDASRRQFLQRAGKVIAGSALAGVVLPHVHAAEDNTIRLALIGCG
ncbi:MAG: gfo/Idh/MocA family oxidoreductase, partial [Verrucomicrobiae bacterium]|nr:gfo/Idh/MocA family oxidoreductase [Verrucomicrobiae bacterium]